MTRKKHSNPILDNPDNGGIHSTRRLKSVHQAMTTHGLKNAIVYQFILSGSNRIEYQATMKALMRHIRTKCRAEYIGAYEVGDEKGGEHAHAYVIVETLHHFPGDLLDVTEGHWIARRVKRKAKAKFNPTDKSLSIRIEAPKNTMHGGAMFARMNTPAKLADCIEWAEYHVKSRSKDDVQDREIYFASEFASNATKREAKRQKYRDALEKSSRPAPATQATPFFPVGFPTEGQQITEKESQHERSIRESVCRASRRSSQSEASSQGQASSTESSSSGSTLGFARPGSIDAPQARSSGPTGQAFRLEQAHGATTSQGSKTHQPITPHPGINHLNFQAVDCDPAPTTGGSIMLTTAQKYIATRYEEAVDLGLDLDAVRAYLMAHGIRHTPAQVVFDLDETYGFYGYTASHPAPANMSTEVMDRNIDQMKVREVKRLFVQHKRTLPRRLDSGLHS